jgi:hypothetical protein
MGSEGDPRVLMVMNVVLSAAFGYVLVTALSLIGLVEFTPTTFALTALFFVVVTWIVVLR